VAHGFGQRFDLPLPLWLWVAGAAATLVLSFAIVGYFMRAEPRAPRSVPIGLPGQRTMIVGARLASAALFVIALAAGLFGTQDPYHNLAPVMVWVVWWVGLAFFCALIGNVWELVNPLATLYPAGSRSFTLRYPAWLGAWPAVLLFLAFAWAELVWRDKDLPAYLAWAVLAYTAITWVGMALFGRDVWLTRGEAFSLAFGVLGRFAPIDTRRFVLRWPGAGLASGEKVPFSFLVFVLLMLATVTFDGFLETPLAERMSTAVQSSRGLAHVLFALSEYGVEESQVVASAALVIFPLAFLAAFLATAACMKQLTRRWRPDLGVQETACAFVLTLVPIAVAYHLSHYFSLLLTAGQFVVPLASDPFGFGWNLFGTAGYKVDLGVVSPYVFWYGAVTLIVVGHVIAVVLAHGVALRMFGERRAALVSQLPMLALMIAYTMLSLWIMAQPIVG
jgi:hypothetical protein